MIKNCFYTLVLLLGRSSNTVLAGISRPQLSVGLSPDSSKTLGGLEPKVKWEASSSVAGVDVQGGLVSTLEEGSFDEIPPTSVWGKLTKSGCPGGVDVSLRGDIKNVKSSPEKVALDLRIKGIVGSNIQVNGDADVDAATVKFSKVQITKKIKNLFGGTWTINPKYNIASSSSDVSVGYVVDDDIYTKVQIDAKQRKLSMSRSFFDNTVMVSPTVTASGDYSISYAQTLENGSKLTTTYTPNNSIKTNWSDGRWDATITAPIHGYYTANEGITVSIKHNVVVF